ncbi:MAG: hypothetical protein ACTTJO_00205 [Metamycoplasmataceae bacterium]
MSKKTQENLLAPVNNQAPAPYQPMNNMMPATQVPTQITPFVPQSNLMPMMPMTPTAFPAVNTQSKEDIEANARFKSGLFWTLTAVSSLAVLGAGTFAIIKTIKSNSVDPNSNLKHLINHVEQFTQNSLTSVAFEDKKKVLEDLVKEAKELLSENKSGTQIIEKTKALYKEFSETLVLYNKQHLSIEKIENYIASKEVQDFRNTLAGYNEYNDFYQEFKDALTKLEQKKNTKNENIEVKDYESALAEFITTFEKLKESKTKRDNKINAYRQLEALWKRAENWKLEVTKNINSNGYTLNFEEWTSILDTALEKANANILSNPNVKIKQNDYKDNTDISKIETEARDLGNAFFNAQKIYNTRIDLGNRKTQLGLDIEKYKSEFQINNQNIFFTEFTNSSVERDFNSLHTFFNSQNQTNKELETKLNAVFNKFKNLKDKSEQLREDIEKTKSEYQKLLDDLLRWRSQQKDKNEIEYLDPRHDQYDFISPLFGENNDLSTGLYSDIKNVLENIVSKWKMQLNQINGTDENSIKFFQNKISSYKEEKKQKHLETKAIVKEIDEFKSLILKNSPEKSTPTGNEEHDVKFVYKLVNTKYEEIIERYIENISGQYIYKNDSNGRIGIKDVLKSKIISSREQYNKDITQLQSDLSNFIKSQVQFLKPGTNDAIDLNNSSEKEQITPSKINQYKAPVFSPTSQLLNNNLQADVTMYADDVNGVLYYDVEFWYGKLELIDPSDPTKGYKSLEKFVFHKTKDSRSINGFKKFAFDESEDGVDKLGLKAHYAMKSDGSYQSIDTIVTTIRNFQHGLTGELDYIGKNDNDKLISINYPTNKEFNTYKYISVSKKDSNTLIFEYEISRKLKNGKKGDITKTLKVRQEINFEQIIKLNKNKSDLKQKQDYIKYLISKLQYFSNNNFKNNALNEFKKEYDDLGKEIKTSIENSNVNTVINTKVEEIPGEDSSDPDAKEKRKSFLDAYNEANKLLSPLLTKMIAEKNKIDLAFVKLKDLLSKANSLYQNMSTSEYKEADKEQSEDLKNNVIGKITTLLEKESFKKSEELQKYFNEFETKFKDIQNNFERMNEKRTSFKLVIEQRKNFYFDVEYLKKYFTEQLKKVLDDANNVLTKTAKDTNTLEKAQKDFETKAVEVINKYTKTKQQYEEILEWNAKISNYIEFHLSDKKYIKGIIDKLIELKNKGIAAVNDNEADENKINNFTTIIKELEKTYNDLTVEIAKELEKFRKLNDFIDEVQKYANGITLTKQAEGNKPFVEGLKAQDYEDITKPLEQALKDAKDKSISENAYTTPGFDSLKETLQTAYSKAKNDKIAKNESKIALLKLINEKVEFLNKWFTNVSFVNVTELENIMIESINRAKTAYDHVGDENNKSDKSYLDDEIKHLQETTNAEKNETNNFKNKFENAKQLAAQKIIEFESEIKKFEETDKEDATNITITNDSELLYEAKYVEAKKALSATHNSGTITGENTFKIVSDKYDELKKQQNNLIINKKQKIQERNDFVEAIKKMAYYMNHARRNRNEAEFQSEYTSITSKFPGFTAEDKSYDKLSFINSSEDKFSTTDQDKINTYRKSLDANLVSTLSANGNDEKTYKYWTDKANAFVNDYISKNLEKLQKAKKAYDEILAKWIDLRNRASENAVYTTVKDKIAAIITEANTKESKAEEDLNPTDIDKVTKELSSTYDANNDALNALVNKVGEIQKLVQDAKSKSTGYYSTHADLSSIDNELVGKYKAAEKSASGQEGAKTIDELNNIHSDIKGSIDAAWSKYIDIMNGYINRLNTFNSEVNNYADKLREGRDANTGIVELKRLKDTLTSPSIEKTSYSQLKSHVETCESLLKNSRGAINSRITVINDLTSQINTSIPHKDRAYNTGHQCCKVCGGGWKRRNYYNLPQSKSAKAEFEKALKNAEDVLTSNEVKNDDEIKSATQGLHNSTDVWTNNSGGGSTCTRNSTNGWDCACVIWY